MPYRVEIHGLSVSCDTAQELSALVRVERSPDIGSGRSVELYTKLEEAEQENVKLKKMLEDAPVQPTLLFGRGVWAKYRREAMTEIHASGPVKAARISTICRNSLCQRPACCSMLLLQLNRPNGTSR